MGFLLGLTYVAHRRWPLRPPPRHESAEAEVSAARTAPFLYAPSWLAVLFIACRCLINGRNEGGPRGEAPGLPREHPPTVADSVYTPRFLSQGFPYGSTFPSLGPARWRGIYPNRYHIIIKKHRSAQATHWRIYTDASLRLHVGGTICRRLLCRRIAASGRAPLGRRRGGIWRHRRCRGGRVRLVLIVIVVVGRRRR